MEPTRIDWQALHPDTVRAEVQAAAELMAGANPIARCTITTTHGLLMLARDAAERGANRQVHLPWAAAVLAPGGIHVLAFCMDHNGVEWRTHWLACLAGQREPAPVWLDVSADAFDRYTAQVGEGEQVHTEVNW
jgi:hypothetical protein